MNRRLMMLSLLVLVVAFTLACTSGGGDDAGDADNQTDGDEELADEANTPDGDEVEPDLDPEEEIVDGDGDPDQIEDDGDVEPDQDIIAGNLELTPSNLDFGELALSEESELNFTMKNNGDAQAEPIEITSIEFFQNSSPNLSLSGNCTLPIVLEPGESFSDCFVRCAVVQPGPISGTLRVVAEETTTGTGLEARATIIGENNVPVVRLDPPRIEFGFVEIDRTEGRFFTIGNVGSAPLMIESVVISEDNDPAVAVTIPEEIEFPYELMANSGVVIEITFSPGSEDQALGWLTVTTNDPQEPEGGRIIPISGRGMQDCPGGLTENGDSCIEDCLPRETVCTDVATFRTCNDDGNWSDAEENCDPGQFCRDGQCLWLVCYDGTTGCVNNQVADCDSSGLMFSEGTACENTSACDIGFCVPGEGCDSRNDRFRCDDGDPCTTDICAESGICRYEYSQAPCEDGNICTESDRCSFGICKGQPVNCNDGITCTVEHCDPDIGCVYEETGATGCTDSNACTWFDHCDGLLCVGDEADCDDGNPCTIDECDPDFGCIYRPSTESCDDGNSCTVDDSCASGFCTGVFPGVYDDGLICNGPEYCDPDQGVYSPYPLQCDDGIACTVDSCDEEAGGCVHTPENSSCDDQNICTQDECVPGEGCSHLPILDGESCIFHGGLLEVCLNGQCVTACELDIDCQDGIDCTLDYCDPTENLCRRELIHSVCQNEQYCDGEEVCTASFGCMPGTPVQCSDPFLCTVDNCDESTDSCIYEPHSDMCDDANDCTADVCRAGEGCVNIARPGMCDDGAVCTLGDYCEGGLCKPGPIRQGCNDGNPCTDDYCDPQNGCQTRFNNLDCDDENPCTEFDSCVSGECVGLARDCDDSVFCNGFESCDGLQCIPGDPVDCDDGVECTIDTCSELEVGCIHETDNSKCDDNNPCTINDTCNLDGCEYPEVADDGTPCGVGASGQKICRDGICVAPCSSNGECADFVDCTEDTCNLETGYCEHVPIEFFCLDPYYCTGVETCHRTLGCQSGVPPNCDDGIACTADTCVNDEETCEHTIDDSLCDDHNPCTSDTCTLDGCTHRNIAGICNDGDNCTVNDQCIAGSCVGEELGCDDNNPCTIDACFAGSGCQHALVENGVACGSGMISRSCQNGVCSEGCLVDSECDDGIACTIDYCSAFDKQCRNEASDELCFDGLACNGEEICDAHAGCMPGEIVVCNDNVDCTSDRCDEEEGGCVFEVDSDGCDDGNTCTFDYCNIAEGCVNESLEGACDDGNACTYNDQCLEGICVGEDNGCDDQNVCTVDGCDPASGCYHIDTSGNCTSDSECRRAACDPLLGCIELVDTGTCDDGNACTLNDVCRAGECTGMSELGCDDNNPCTIDSCDSDDGCKHQLVANGTECESNVAFTNSVCMNGFCVHDCNEDVDCDDYVDCTVDQCNIGTGYCQYTANHDQCSDGIFCNGIEQCEPFIGCVPPSELPCDDGVTCTLDTCNEESDECINETQNGFCDDGNICTLDVCNATSGCVSQPLSGRSCDDGSRCTIGDVCQNGTCHPGSALNCDDANECTGPDECDPNIGCVNPMRSEAEPCGNNDAGVCNAGTCAMPCTQDGECNDGVPCTLDICNPITKHCENVPNNNLCSDNRYCNGSEICHPAFGCVDGVAPSCDDGIECTSDLCDEGLQACLNQPVPAACNDGNSCTTDSCVAGVGCRFANIDGVACDDGSACTVGDMCQLGSCVPGELLDCTSESPCRVGLCDPRIGCYGIISTGDCIDNDACTISSQCIHGECVGVTPLNCADENPCTQDFCDPTTGCNHVATPGAVCSDGNPCTVSDTCNGLFCEGQQRNCDDGNSCTEDSCDAESGCTNTPLGDATECRLPAGGTSTCLDGGCSCSGDGECNDNINCTLDSCTNGICVNTPRDNMCPGQMCDPLMGCIPATECMRDADCDDLNACNGREICNAGQCTPGTAPNCNDNNECTRDSCTESVGCIHQPLNESACDDGNDCTLDDICLGGKCIAQDQLSCFDGNPCTSDECQPDGGCTFEALEDGSICNDLDPCTLGDRCDSGVCISTALNCDDGNPCTLEMCNENGICEYTKLSGVSCDDENSCTESSECVNGTCVGTGVANCDDGNVCTYDFCNPTDGECAHSPQAGVCDDQNACTTEDACRFGNCVGLMPVDCSDGNACTIDTCSDGQCNHEPTEDGSPCDLQSGITEACIAGECIEFCTIDADCNDGIRCTVDTCNSDTNHCSYLPDNSKCSDHNPCNGLETCDPQLSCVSGTPVVCDDEIDCTDDFCDSSSGQCRAEPQNYLCNDDDPCTKDSCEIGQGCVFSPIEGCVP